MHPVSYTHLDVYKRQAWSLHSCDNDDDDSIAVPAALQEAFSSKYPNVKNLKWETKAGYYVADFYDGYEASAWFTTDGNWHMTETDIPYTCLLYTSRCV